MIGSAGNAQQAAIRPWRQARLLAPAGVLLVAALATAAAWHHPFDPRTDGCKYLSLAEALRHATLASRLDPGCQFIWPPGYPLLIAGFPSPDLILAGRLVSALAGVIAPLLLFFLLRPAGLTAAAVGALCCALLPLRSELSQTVLSDAPSLALSLALLLVACRAQGWKAWAGVGLAGGLAILTRPEAAIIVAAALAILAGRRLFIPLAIAGALAALVCLPYAIYYHRNAGGLFLLSKANMNRWLAPRALAGLPWGDLDYGAEQHAREIEYFSSPWRRLPANLSRTLPPLVRRYPLLLAGTLLALGALIRRSEQRRAIVLIALAGIPTLTAHFYFVLPRMMLAGEAALCGLGAIGWWWAVGRRRGAQAVLALLLPLTVLPQWWYHDFSSSRPSRRRDEVMRIAAQLRRQHPPHRPLRIACHGILPAFYAGGEWIYISPHWPRSKAWELGADVIVVKGKRFRLIYRPRQR